MTVAGTLPKKQHCDTVRQFVLVDRKGFWCWPTSENHPRPFSLGSVTAPHLMHTIERSHWCFSRGSSRSFHATTSLFLNAPPAASAMSPTKATAVPIKNPSLPPIAPKMTTSTTAPKHPRPEAPALAGSRAAGGVNRSASNACRLPTDEVAALPTARLSPTRPTELVRAVDVVLCVFASYTSDTFLTSSLPHCAHRPSEVCVAGIADLGAGTPAVEKPPRGLVVGKEGVLALLRASLPIAVSVDAATGQPQCGHAAALVDTIREQSGQAISGIVQLNTGGCKSYA
jgi:hypothetical protein